MRQFLCQLAYSNLWIAMAAVGHAYVNCRLLGIQAPQACWLCGLSMFFVYTFAKTVRFDPEADQANDPERMAFLMRWRWPLIALASLGFLQGLRLTYASPIRALLFTFALLGAIFYDVKWLPRHFRYRRLKDITGVKSLVVGLIWGLQTTALPAYEAGLSLIHPAVVGLYLYGGLSWFINTVYFDIGDMKGDQLEGVVTLPLHWGLSRTVARLHWINLSAQLLLASLWGLGWVSSAALWLLPVAGFNWLYIRQARSQDSELGFWCDVIADGTWVFFGLYLAALSSLKILGSI
ncbi:hypothetical protein JST97_24530 [bacterium]|nr:hypothetical protein [bacterium]